jgi:hypothetical protein
MLVWASGLGVVAELGEWGAPSGEVWAPELGVCAELGWKARLAVVWAPVGSRCRTGEWGALPGGCLGSRVGADVVGGWW